MEKLGEAPAMIERDDNFPPFEELLAELDRMRAIDARIAADGDGARSAA